MPDKLIMTDLQLRIILQALMAAASHSTNAHLQYLTLEQFVKAHPEQQLFILSVKEEKRKHG